MLNNVKHHIHEAGRMSAELRDRVQERWNVTFFAVEEVRGSLEREFGDLSQQAEVIPTEQTPAAPRLVGNVIDLEDRRDRQVLLEQTARDRHLIEARNDVAGAYDELAA